MKFSIILLYSLSFCACTFSSEILSFSASRIKAEATEDAIFIKANNDTILNVKDMISVVSEKTVTKSTVTIKISRACQKCGEQAFVLPFVFEFDFQSDAEKFMEFIWKVRTINSRK